MRLPFCNFQTVQGVQVRRKQKTKSRIGIYGFIEEQVYHLFFNFERIWWVWIDSISTGPRVHESENDGSADLYCTYSQ